MPLHVVLYQPQIPPNTGNVIRLCANTGAKLHLIEPLGFTLDNTRLRRAGLDYHQWADMSVHASLDDCLRDKSGNVWGFTTKASRAHCAATFADDDVLLFGPETSGLPDTVLASLTKRISVGRTVCAWTESTARSSVAEQLKQGMSTLTGAFIVATSPILTGRHNRQGQIGIAVLKLSRARAPFHASIPSPEAIWRHVNLHAPIPHVRA